MKNCYKLIHVLSCVLFIYLLNSIQSHAQINTPHHFIETFGTATSMNSISRTSEGGINSRFSTTPLSYINPNELLFYSSQNALPGQNGENWGPIYTEYQQSGVTVRRGAYSVVTNSKGYNQSYFYAGLDHTPGDFQNGFMLLVDSHNNTTLYFDRILTTGDGLKPGSGYKFSLWIKNVNNEVDENKPSPQVRISVYDNSEYIKHNNPDSPVGRLAFATGAPPANTPTSGEPEWHKIELKIEALPTVVSAVRLQIKNIVTSELGNDLAIDDIEFISLEVLAIDDYYGPFSTSTGGVTPSSVLTNDKVNNVLIDSEVSPLPVTLTPGASPLPGQIEMGATGIITVKPGTPPGPYQYPYTICSTDPEFTDVCDQAIAYFEVVCDVTTYIGGTVTLDDTGEPLAGIPLSLVPQFPDGDTLRLWTNTLGEFRFKDFVPGEYLLQVQDQVIVLGESLFPVGSSLFWADLQPCAPVVHHFVYENSNMPAIGDFVWLDINGNGIQDEWYDANGDDKITKNDIDIENFEMLNYEDWEWVDLNGNGTWDGPGDEGELNKAGLGNAAFPNIKVTGPGGYSKDIIVGVDGLWRDRPHVEPWENQEGIFGEFTVELVRDATFDALAIKLAATGKVKTYDSEGNAVIPPPAGGRLAFSSARTSRTADDPVYEVYGPNGLTLSGSVSPPQPTNMDLDHGLSVREVSLPVSWIDFSANWDKETNAVSLSWSTAAEFDNKGFEVEYSEDALKWKKIGFVAAEEAKADGVAHYYRFSHGGAANGMNYYRLKQLDHGGGFDYSVVRSLTVSGLVQYSVYPNPASDVLQLSQSVYSKGVKSVQLVDPTGRTVRKYEGDQSKLSLIGLDSGLYHLKVFFNDGSAETTKVVKK